MKWLALLLLIPCSLFGQSCTTAVCNAATVAETDVATALPSNSTTQATVTVNIPTGSATWTSELTGACWTVPSAVTTLYITGAGTPNTGTATFGSGTINTTITDNAGTSNPLICIQANQGQTVEWALTTILPQSASTSLQDPMWWKGTCNSSGCPNMRLDNVEFGNGSVQWTDSGNATGLITTTGFYGVLDHNTVPTGSNIHLADVNFGAWLGTGQYGDNSWAQPDSFGTASNLFFENNVFYTLDIPMVDMETAIGSSALEGGGRYVARYNEGYITGSNGWLISNHGTDTSGRIRSLRSIEAYGNTVTVTGTGSQQIALTAIRGGSLIEWGNSLNLNTETAQYYIGLANYRRFGSYSPWGYGAGNGSYDTNDGTTYASGTATGGNGTTTLQDTSKSWTTNQWQDSGDPYSVTDTTSGCASEIISNTSNTLTTMGVIGNSQTCSSGFAASNGDSYEILRTSVLIDQQARGQGNYISGTTPSPTGSVAQALDPIYQWNDALTSGSVNNDIAADAGDLSIIAYRDWYAQASGIQTSSSSPFSCNGSTGGTGWGTLANRPTSCSGACSANTLGCGYYATDQSTLYVWKSGAWSSYYTPYTYPHPLTVTAQPPGNSFNGLLKSQ